MLLEHTLLEVALALTHMTATLTLHPLQHEQVGVNLGLNFKMEKTLQTDLVLGQTDDTNSITVH